MPARVAIANIIPKPVFIENSKSSVTLGGGIKGFMPRAVVDSDNTNSFAVTRLTLRESWNTLYSRKLQNNKRVITPFRAINNSGDILSRTNYTCGGNCQTPQSRPGMFGLKNSFGAIQNKCDDSLVPPSACNVKYVYDSSNYTTYLKQRAVNKNYNDRSFGGNENNGAQNTIRSSTRFFM
jgi:hypothetical protein